LPVYLIERYFYIQARCAKDSTTQIVVSPMLEL